MWTKEELDKIFQWLDSSRPQMIEMQKQLTAIPALSPKSGGEGEAEKAGFVMEKLKEWHFSDIELHKAPADDAPSGYRPSLVARVPGRSSERTVWAMTHLDVVPPGSRDLWETDPYKVVEKDGKLFGRGVEDNQQSMVASIFASRALIELDLKPAYDVALLLVADEETGSEFGVSYLLREKQLFRKEDIILVPDGGNPQGDMIEVAEKSICWMKFTVKGKQSHGSRPDMGINAHRASANIIVHLDKLLHKKYSAEDPVFDFPISTFEPTKKEANVENINTIPGEDIFCFDCRILPNYNLDEVLKFVEDEARKVAQGFGAQVTVEPVQKQAAAPPTPVDSDVVKRLTVAISDVYGVKARPQGIGGGTVAALLRKEGFEAAVWGRIDETMHQPNEYCRIENMIGDAKVFAHVFGQE